MRTRNWCVTSWTCPDYDSVERLVVSGEYKYVCVGKETCPRTGKVHWHWYLQAVNNKSMRQIKKDVGDRMAHAEAANGPADAGIAYVKKDGEWKEWGEPKKQGRRSDLEDCKKIIDNSVDDAMGTMQQIADTHFGDFVRYYRGFAKYADLVDIKRAKQREPHMPEVIVYLGRAGSGKSYHCYHDEGYQRSGYRYLVQMESKTYFDGYDGEKTIWFDEFSGRVMSFTVFTQIVDQWGSRVETKGGSRQIFPERFLISTVEWPSQWWAGSSRFNADPYQLYRRITKIYWCRGPGQEPVELKKDGWTCKNIDEYEELFGKLP